MARKSKTLGIVPLGPQTSKGQRAVHRSVADDATVYLWALAENPQEVARLLKATPKRAQQSARALYEEIRRRHKEQGGKHQGSLEGLIYLNLFASQLAPNPQESTFLFLEAAAVLSRAHTQGLSFTKKELTRCVQAALDNLQVSIALALPKGGGPVGEANRTPGTATPGQPWPPKSFEYQGQRALQQSYDGPEKEVVAAMLLDLAQNPLEVARILKRTPKKTQQAARSFYRKLRKRLEDLLWMLPLQDSPTLRISVYLHLVASHLAPTPPESTFLFVEAAKIVRRAMKKGEQWTDDLVPLVQEVLDAVQLASRGTVGEANRTLGQANIEQARGLRPRARCDVSCKTCVHYLAKGHSGKGYCQLFDFWTYKKWVCDSWRGAGIYAKGE